MNKPYYPATMAGILAAAWMQENFGMRFQYEHNGELHDVDLLRYLQIETHYIHPDSMHLLKPQVGDIVQGNQVGIFRGKATWVDGEWMYGAGDQICATNNGKIIQRGGVAFMWPEECQPS